MKIQKNKKEVEHESFYLNFGGYHVYTVDRATLKYLLLKTGGKIMWNGHMENIRFRHLGVNVYNVTANPSIDP